MRRITVVLGLAVLMAATVVLTAGAAVAQASFTAPQSFRTGDTAEAVVSADFNGDSKADLAVANNGFNSGILTDNVSVLLGNGDGTFGAAQNFGGVDGPFSVSSADFNGDSKADLAVAYNGAFTIPGGVSVRLGNGDGTFGAAQNFVAGLHPTSVSSADFNGDSKVDLATANAGSDNVSVLLGKGDGTFGTAQNFAAADSPWFVTSTDFNDDSKVDLATANAPSIMGDGGLGNVSVLLGKGDGTFGTAQNFGAGDTPVYLASEDFDGDSKVDLAVANNSSDNVSVLSGNGDGIFQTAQNFAAGSSPSSLVGGLFNNDSEADLAVTNEILSGTVSIMLNNTDTTAPTAKAPTHSFTTLSTLGTSTVPVKLTWSATDNPGGSGIASYQLQQSVNGGAYTNIALPSATATTISRSLAPGANTYRYRVAATDNAGNVSAWATGPSFKVTASQESSSAIVDTGSWTTSALSGAYGGSVHSARALGRNATFTVPSGTKNVEWISYRGNRGKAQVWLDGVQQDANPTLTGIQPFDLYSSTVQARKVVFSKAVSSTTSHKLEVRVLGQKNASSTSTRVDIDAFVRTS